LQDFTGQKRKLHSYVYFLVFIVQKEIFDDSREFRRLGHQVRAVVREGDERRAPTYRQVVEIHLVVFFVLAHFE
jgi:hypothetical protein